MDYQDRKISIISRDDKIRKRINKLFNNRLSTHWESKTENILQSLENESSDIVILTSSACQNADCNKILTGINRISPITQIIVLVEPQDIKLAISALKKGMFQYAKLPVSDQELKLLIETALEKQPQYGQDVPIEKSGRRERFGPLIGKSLPMQQIYHQIEQAAATDIPILLLGETGCGKDLVSQTIHRESDRKSKPYIPVNLGALPQQLVGSELFGHEKGAFTGSVSQHKGVFEQGIDGTVFLDEIDTIEEKVQVSLLRLIEQKKFNRLGGKQAIKSNARIIAASNENLEELVERGVFRKDLFYRLDVFRIPIPPLREHLEDLSLLVQEMMARYNNQFNKKINKISEECIQSLEAYEWPGNIRELKNVIQRAVLVCNNETILPEHLPPRFRSNRKSSPTVTFEIGTSLDKVEKEMVVRALEMADNNRKKAAELLGISRRAIYNKLKKHNID